MKLANDYLGLRKAFAAMREGEAFPVTMNQIADTLFCTPRNAKLILNKMIELQWLHYVPGRGRGHTSELTFLMDKQEILQREAEELFKVGNTEEAFRLVKQFGDGIADNERFVEWLTNYFGYRVEDKDNQFIETLKLPIYRKLNTLDPREAFYALDSHLVRQIFCTLVDYDFQTNEIKGSIAHHWRMNEDASQWTLYLRKGVLFHHGRELTAHDVKFTFERLREPESKQQWLVQSIDRIEVLSRYALQVTCKHPNYLFLHYASFTPMSIVPEDQYNQSSSLSTEVVIGCGPYKVVAQKTGMLAMEAFASYFQGRAFIDRIEILIVPDLQEEFTFEPKTDYLMVHSGETEKQTVETWQEDEGLRGVSIFSINTRKPGPLQDLSLRKALTYAIDRQKLIADLGELRHYPAKSIQKLGTPLSDDPDWRYNEALQYLHESSYQGEKLQLYTYARHAPDAYWLSEAYSKIGIQVDVNIVSWADMLLESYKEKADLILFEAMVSEGIMRNLETYQSPYSFVRTHLSDLLSAKVDEAILTILQEASEDDRTAKLSQIEQMLLDEYSIVFLVYKSIRTISPPAMQGVQMSSNGWVNFKDIWYLLTD